MWLTEIHEGGFTSPARAPHDRRRPCVLCNVDEAERVLAELTERSKHRPVSSPLITLLCFTLERRDEGFDWLERAYEARDLVLRLLLPVLGASEIADGDPRFANLLERMGLES